MLFHACFSGPQKVLDKHWKPKDVASGIKGFSVPLPPTPLSGMYNKDGGKTQHTLKLDQDESSFCDSPTAKMFWEMIKFWLIFTRLNFAVCTIYSWLLLDVLQVKDSILILDKDTNLLSARYQYSLVLFYSPMKWTG